MGSLELIGMPSDNILHQSDCTWLCSLLCQLLDGIIDVTLFDGVEGLDYKIIKISTFWFELAASF